MTTAQAVTSVVYFDQHLGAAHPKQKRWSKYAFLTFLMAKAKKEEKSKKFAAKIYLSYKIIRSIFY